MKNLRWQILIVVLALVAIGVLLLGQQPALQPVPAEIQPATGGVYTEGLVGSLMRLNPALDFYNPADRDVNRLLFSSLIRFDSRGLPQYDLAESMGISQDGTIYNFSLRAGAIWHDGKPVSAQDVIFTIDLLREQLIPVPEDLKALWDAIDVEALNERTLQFRLAEPFSPFLDHLTFGILPEHLLGDLTTEEIVAATFNLNPVGSGPYSFERILVEDEEIAGLVLAAFPEYYGEKPFIEQLVFRYYPDSASALAAYRAGEIQGISNITPDVLQASLAEPELNLYSGRLPQLSLILLNLDNPEVGFLQEAEIRRALLMGINRQRIIDRFLDGQAILADAPIFPGSWAFYEDIERLEFDPEAAVALLKDLGFTIPASGGNVREREEQSLAFVLLHPDTERHTYLAEAIARDWERMGIAVTLEAVPYDRLVSEHLDPRLYEAALVDLDLARSPDPDPYPFWHQAQITGGQNYAKWEDRQASEYLEQARVVVDIAERTRLYRNFQVRFTQEMPALPLFYPVFTFAVDDQIQGVTMGPLFDNSDRFATIMDWFLVARRGVAEAGTAEAEALPPPEDGPASTP